MKGILKSKAGSRVWQFFILVTILAIISFVISFGSQYNRFRDAVAVKTNEVVQLPHAVELPFRLGLDLQGGTHLVYQADVSQVADDANIAVEGVRDIIERRVNVFGVSEPVVQVNHTAGGEYRIIAELAGISDVNEAIKMIGETPILEFKEQDTAVTLSPAETESFSAEKKVKEAKAEEVLGKLISGGDFQALAKEFSEDETTKDGGGDLGWVTESQYSQQIAAVKDWKDGDVSKELLETTSGFELLRYKGKREMTDAFTNKPVREVQASHILLCYNEIEGCENNLSKDETYAKIKDIKSKATSANFADLAKEYSTEPGAAQSSGDLGWFGKGQMVAPFEDAVFEQEVGTVSYVVETQFGYHIIHKRAERPIYEYNLERILIKNPEQAAPAAEQNWKNTELTGKYLKRASVEFNPNDNTPQVALEFDDEGSKLFEDITERNVQKQVAIFLDGYAISSPTVNEKITGGKAVISGSFNIQEAKLLAQRLNAGALPVPIELISQSTVGASLGKASIATSMRAGIIGLILVALFMIIYYRFPGILSVFSLVFYGMLVLAIFKVMPVWLSLVVVVMLVGLMIYTFAELGIFDGPLAILIIIMGILLFSFAYSSITLTLAGLAGFLLSVGMAVDANVLIFERIREELRLGKTLRTAIDEGFRRAWPSIRDGNVTTVFICLILMWFGTGAVQGFGTTLFIGVSVSMFSAIVATRSLLMVTAGKWLENKLWLMGAKSNK